MLREDARAESAVGRARDILEAACTVICREGMFSFTLTDVARAAGVSQPLVSYYYETRAQLIREAFEYANVRAGRYADAAVADVPLGFDRLERFLEVLLEPHPHPRESWTIWRQAWAYAYFSSELQAAVRTRYAAWVDAIAHHVRAGLDDGSIAPGPDADAAAQAIAAAADGISAPLLHGLVEPAEALRVIRDVTRRELGSRALT